MDNNEFERLLKLAGLTKKEFAERTGLHKNTITNWKQSEVPLWVDDWLGNHIKAQAFDQLIDTAEQLKKEIE